MIPDVLMVSEALFLGMARFCGLPTQSEIAVMVLPFTLMPSRCHLEEKSFCLDSVQMESWKRLTFRQPSWART